MADMNSSDDLRRHFDIADRFLEHGLLLYFSGRNPGRLQAHVAEVDHDYHRVQLGVDFDSDSQLGAASAAAEWLEQSLEGSRIAYPRPGDESSRLRQALVKLTQGRVKMEWWDATWAPSSLRMWGAPDPSWVGLAYGAGGIVDVGVGPTPFSVKEAVAARLGLGARS